jgi:hypothetical protein
MSTETLTLVGIVAGVLVVFGGGLYWWFNRTPRVSRDGDGRIPLFGAGFDVDVDGNPLASQPVHTPPLPAGQAPYAETRRGVEPPGAAGSAAARNAARPSFAAPTTPPSFPPPLMPPSPPRGVPVVSPEDDLYGALPITPVPEAEPAPRPSERALPPERARPTVRTFTTSPADATDRVPLTNVSVPPAALSGAPLSGAPAAQPTAARVAPAGGAAGPASAAASVAANGVPGTMVEGHLLRFSVPAEGTLQFLPGRLEIAAGLDAGREIRFVNVPGPQGTEVTFGRSDGELYRHIQLRDQTVSRSHARMRLVDGRWFLLNLSQTNPVVQNGRSLATGEERPVEDGDRIEMGEVLFTFRSR